jgi:nicotinamidase-related amidase
MVLRRAEPHQEGMSAMSNHQALLIIDPLNDFIAEGGKLWPYAREVAEELHLMNNLRQLVAGARASGTTVVYVPHHRHERGDFDGWRYLNPTHERAKALLPFERGTWGAQFHADLEPTAGDVIVGDHWFQNGFMNTDLEHALRVRGLERLFVAGMRTNTCVEATARHAVELGHHVTLVKDATAAFRWDEWRATVEVNAPTFAHRICSTAEALESMARAGASS